MYIFDELADKWQQVRGYLGQAYITFKANHPLLTSLTNPRLRVDQAQTSFFEGKQFRTFIEYSIPAGETRVIRVTSPVNFVLLGQTLECDEGFCRMVAVAGGGTPGGSFSDALPIIGKNRMTERPLPYYAAQITVHTGGTHVDGTPVEILRVKTANATAQQSSVGGGVNDERGLPPGVYYIRLNNPGSGPASGVYSFFWEERQ